MKRLLFIAVVFNTVKETRDLCLSLARQDPGDYELALVLVDNSDTEPGRAGVDALAAEFAFAEVLRPERNLGYFPAISQALQRFARGYDYVVAGNNDLVYDGNFCATLVAQCYGDDIMVVCPDVVTANGVHQNPHHKHRLSTLEKAYFDLYFLGYPIAWALTQARRLFSRRLSPTAEAGVEPAQIIDQGVGAVYVFVPHFLEKIDRALYFPGFLYGEEACLSWQIRSVGGKTLFDPTLKVWHAESATLGQISERGTYGFARESYWKFRSKL